jgi:hypothetical protein
LSVPAELRLPQPRPTRAFVNKPYPFSRSYLIPFAELVAQNFQFSPQRWSWSRQHSECRSLRGPEGKGGKHRRNSTCRSGYVQIVIDQKHYYAHRNIGFGSMADSPHAAARLLGEFSQATRLATADVNRSFASGYFPTYV